MPPPIIGESQFRPTLFKISDIFEIINCSFGKRKAPGFPRAFPIAFAY